MQQVAFLKGIGQMEMVSGYYFKVVQQRTSNFETTEPPLVFFWGEKLTD